MNATPRFDDEQVLHGYRAAAERLMIATIGIPASGHPRPGGGDPGVSRTLRHGDLDQHHFPGSDSGAGVIKDISDALKEQSAATQDIAKNVERIAQAAETSEQAAGSMMEEISRLKTSAASLTGAVSHFRLA